MKMDITIPYYEDNSRINNSSIGCYLKKGPKYLHDMLSGKIKEQPTRNMEKGTMIHMYLLQPDEFDKTYLISNMLIPTTDNQKTFCIEYANSLEIDSKLAAISAYKVAYKTDRLSEEKIALKATEMASTFNSYINHLRSKNNKIVINIFDEKMLNTIYSNITSHIAADKLLFPNSDIETHNEFHINWEYEGISCKSLLDKCSFDYKNKVCQIIDLKTTSHIYDFEKSVIDFDYLRQLCFYFMSVCWYLKSVKEIDITDWTFKFAIIAISTDDYSIRVFDIKLEDILPKKKIITDVLHDIKWHKDNELWEHYMSYYLNDGYETLNFEKHV